MLSTVASARAAHLERLKRIADAAVPDKPIDLKNRMLASRRPFGNVEPPPRPIPPPPRRDWLNVGTVSETNLEKIRRVTSAYFNIPTFIIRSHRRERPIVQARMICMYLARELTSLSLPQIGYHMGGFDHSSVIHSIARVTELRKTDPKTEEAVTALMAELSPQETTNVQD